MAAAEAVKSALLLAGLQGSDEAPNAILATLKERRDVLVDLLKEDGVRAGQAGQVQRQLHGDADAELEQHPGHDHRHRLARLDVQGEVIEHRPPGAVAKT